MLNFILGTQDGDARTATLETAHGTIITPTFMPVGTGGTVKAMRPEDLRESGSSIILANTYHLMLRPGAERINSLGGLHNFMNWDGPILTDSGGFQVMSLAKLSQLNEEGVTFRSHINGSKYLLTPERAIEIQQLLGSDISMVFDECTPYPVNKQVAQNSVELSMRWAERSKKAYMPKFGHGLFGIVQGSIYEELRAWSASSLTNIGFDGYALGGLAVGERQQDMFRTVSATVHYLPKNRPRYLMGVGKPEDIVGAVERGIDMFDCVLPTRSGRTGQAFASRGEINLRNARHADDPRPIDEFCKCQVCTRYSRAYLHHLIKSKEILGSMLLTAHNLSYYHDLMSGLRAAITDNQLNDYIANFHNIRSKGDIPPI